MTNTFKEDLKRGIAVEELLLLKLQSTYPCATLITAFKGYDIWIPEKNISLEVKYDPMSNQTGNIVVEIEFNGKESALMTTTADYWVFYDDKIFMSISPKDIIKCILFNKYTYKEFVGNGDTAPKKAFLIPKDVLFKYGKPIK